MWIKKQIGLIEYFVWGDNPRFLIVSGMHGDEAMTAHLLKKYLNDHHKDLPSFVYIPFVSPSAVTLGTRLNADGVDINRSFVTDPVVEEVRSVIEIIKDYKFDLVLDFHEDRDRDLGFYMYDNEGRLDEKQLNEFGRLVKKLGLSMYEGYDDEEDPTLGLVVKNGYVATQGCAKKIDMGFMSSWVVKFGIAPRQIDFEVPGKADEQIKDVLVAGLVKLGLRGVVHR